mmetsp:Transcript_29964/g.48818  ORF Transcript_29964/g.48818 Transcript_29964/m.48818 type:complete len:207 (-) Transcript_29964:619-1239(-)
MAVYNQQPTMYMQQYTTPDVNMEETHQYLQYQQYQQSLDSLLTQPLLSFNVNTAHNNALDFNFMQNSAFIAALNHLNAQYLMHMNCNQAMTQTNGVSSMESVLNALSLKQPMLSDEQCVVSSSSLTMEAAEFDPFSAREHRTQRSHTADMDDTECADHKSSGSESPKLKATSNEFIPGITSICTSLMQSGGAQLDVIVEVDEVDAI